MTLLASRKGNRHRIGRFVLLHYLQQDLCYIPRGRSSPGCDVVLVEAPGETDDMQLSRHRRGWYVGRHDV